MNNWWLKYETTSSVAEFLNYSYFKLNSWSRISTNVRTRLPLNGHQTRVLHNPVYNSFARSDCSSHNIKGECFVLWLKVFTENGTLTQY